MGAAGLPAGGALPWGRFTLKRSRVPGAAPAGTATVCATPSGMRHMSLAPSLLWGGRVRVM